MEAIRILLVDDHQVVREGLRHMLGFQADLEVVGEAGDAEEALALAESLHPDVVLMDVKMPGMDGIELTRLLKEKQPSCNVIVLTLYEEYLGQAIKAGAVGYLSKDVKREELIQAIRASQQGRSPLHLSLSRDVFADLATQAENASQRGASLSERELAVLRLIAGGATTKEIAERFFISEATVKRSVRLLLEKLAAHNRSEAVSEAHKRGLI